MQACRKMGEEKSGAPTLNMEAAGLLKTMVNFFHATWHVPEHSVFCCIRYTISDPELQKKAHVCSCINIFILLSSVFKFGISFWYVIWNLQQYTLV